ncbi:metal ABC transporter permease [Rhizobium sp. SEMIA 4085]|uniref:Mn/Zn ABC transporter permease protein n=1 Tax=Rhizobium gallicum bv. gallicum R602sp TaxID=1041138 RepID=A0A0B4XIC4_9HYPH|nr:MULTISPECIES: metal ABC transporter permease [Rhizobium]AJD46187.1 Mn/Zn ABC transporter permease protein [Rhizobium gallicum bv. gallicum R602sp]NNH28545.1 metal ABC transporter permease [Rhizobium sp. SEMIA 4085]TDW32404.1 manganese/iron transport system permease protein [Rhizobium azibense]
MNILETLVSPFQFGFMVNALVISMLVAVPTALLSCFLVVKGWSLLGDAISHAVFPGVVIAYIIGIPFAVGAFVTGMFCAVATGFLKDNSRIKQDTVMGIVFSGMFGFGLVLYVKIQSEVHLDHILFGDMLGVGWRDIAEAAVIAALTAGIIGIKWKDFLLHAFDPAQARAVGLRVNLLHYGLLCLISLTVVGALKAVGIILAIAMLIAPGAIAFLLTRRFSRMLILSVVIALIASSAGIYLSFFIDSAPAPTIVLMLSILFTAAFIVTVRTKRSQATLQ